MLWALVALNVAFVGILLAASGVRHFFRCTDRAILEVIQVVQIFYTHSLLYLPYLLSVVGKVTNWVKIKPMYH